MNIEEYLTALRQAKLSPATIDAYTRELNRFRDYARAHRLRITQIKPAIVMQYMAEMDVSIPRKAKPCAAG